MPRRITKAKINFISLVPKGANQMPVIYKSEDKEAEFTPMIKTLDDFEEKGELLAVVYAPEVEDSQGDLASAEVIKEMMHGFSKEGQGVDFRHNNKAFSKEDVYVAESFEIQKGDERFQGFLDYQGNEVDVTGGWGVVIKIESEELRKLYREGKWNGVSMGGSARSETAKEKVDKLSKLKNGDVDMTPDEIKALIKESISDAMKATETSTEPVTKTEKEDDKPVFKGEVTVENIRKFHQQVKLDRLQKEVDWSDSESVAAFQEEVRKMEDAMQESAEADKEAGIEKEDTEEVKVLKRQLHKAQKRSNQDATSKRVEKGDDLTSFEKAQDDLVAEIQKELDAPYTK